MPLPSYSFTGSSAAQASAMSSAFSNLGLTVPVNSPSSSIANIIAGDLLKADTISKANRSKKIAHHNETTDAVYDFVSNNYPEVVYGVESSLGLNSENQFNTSGRKVSSSRVSSSSGSGSVSGSLAASVPSVSAINYIDAPLAQQYGMDALTAYQEALANTAHQREMLDLQRAGLNPVLAARYSGAGIFSPDSMVTAASDGSGSSGSGGSGGSSRRAKQTSGVLPTLLGAIATIASGKTAVGAAVSSVAEAIIPAFKDK